MPGPLRAHLVAALLFAVGVAVVAVFWQYPQLLVYLLLAIVAVLAYSALYLIVASRLDPVARSQVPPGPPLAPAPLEAEDTAPGRRPARARARARAPEKES